MKWALVLSGGGARGFAYIGLLQFLHKQGYPKPDLIVGCSIGAIIGGIYAAGMSPDEMKEFMIHEFDLKNYVSIAQMALPSSKVSRVIKMGEGLTHMLRGTGMDDGVKVTEFLRHMTNNINIEDTLIPFMCNATDLLSGKEAVFKKGNMAEALRASMSIPGIFEPATVQYSLYIDGYITHNTPTWIAREAGFSHVLTIYLDKFAPKMPEDISSSISVIMRSIEIAVSADKVRSIDVPTTSLLLPDMYSAYNFEHIEERIRNGYTISHTYKQTLERFFDQRPLRGYFARKKLSQIERQQGTLH